MNEPTFESLSPEAQAIARSMVEFCVRNGYCMGQDEGFKDFETGERHPEIQELIKFSEGY